MRRVQSPAKGGRDSFAIQLDRSPVWRSHGTVPRKDSRQIVRRKTALALAFRAGSGEDSVVYKRLYIPKPGFPA